LQCGSLLFFPVDIRNNQVLTDYEKAEQDGLERRLPLLKSAQWSKFFSKSEAVTIQVAAFCFLKLW
jgi:hypothetical protein